MLAQHLLHWVTIMMNMIYFESIHKQNIKWIHSFKNLKKYSIYSCVNNVQLFHIAVYICDPFVKSYTFSIGTNELREDRKYWFWLMVFVDNNKIILAGLLSLCVVTTVLFVDAEKGCRITKEILASTSLDWDNLLHEHLVIRCEMHELIMIALRLDLFLPFWCQNHWTI